MKPIRIGAQLNDVRDPSGDQTAKVTLPLQVLSQRGLDFDTINNERKALEHEYFTTVNTLREIIKAIRSKAINSRVLLYWDFGDQVVKFEEQNEKHQVFLENFVKHVVKKLGISAKMVNRCRKFRKLYPERSTIDLNRTFDSYVATFEGGYISKSRLRLNP